MSITRLTNCLTALRAMLSQHPRALDASPETLGELLFELRYLGWKPDEHEVAATLEALRLDDGRAAA